MHYSTWYGRYTCTAMTSSLVVAWMTFFRVMFDFRFMRLTQKTSPKILISEAAGLQIREVTVKFSYFSTKTNVMGTQKNHLIGTVLLGTHLFIY